MDLAYPHRGARALVILHERSLREFLGEWRRFRCSGRPLPDTEDPSYRSPELLLRHVLGAARGYMMWICTNLELPDPSIRESPPQEHIEAMADEYLEHLIERWRLPLVDLTEKVADRSVHDSSWGVPYCIDAMLEHAVMHPIRHGFQLRELLERG